MSVRPAFVAIGVFFLAMIPFTVMAALIRNVHDMGSFPFVMSALCGEAAYLLRWDAIARQNRKR